MTDHVHEIEIAGAVEADLVGLEHGGIAGWTAIAGVAAFAGAGHDGKPPRRQFHSANPVIPEIAEVQGSVRP